MFESPAGQPGQPLSESDSPRRRGMRQRLIAEDGHSFLVADLRDSLESSDKYTKVNCGGFGRVRTFNKFSIHLRSRNSALETRTNFRGLPRKVPFSTQVFQLAGCNWDCWYCFVDDSLLAGDSSKGTFLSAADMVQLYLDESDRPEVIDLSGGQPDLVPEWCNETMHELERRGLRGKVHVWVDDNLSGDFMRRYLSVEEIEYMAKFPLHSRVGCFKGFDYDSFVLNSGAHERGYDRQFEVMSHLIDDGFDMYAYATFTNVANGELTKAMAAFVDRLQQVHPQLPLRTIPLEVRPYTAAQKRVVGRDVTLHYERQYDAAKAWEDELQRRFSDEQLRSPLELISLG